jgi:hypothetical protein
MIWERIFVKLRKSSSNGNSKALQPCADVRAVAAADGLAVFDMGRGVMFKANAVGSEIWRCIIEQHRDEGSVARALAGRFGVPAEQARIDVSRFLGQLREQGLVRSV